MNAPDHHPPGSPPSVDRTADTLGRRRAAVLAGHAGDVGAARSFLADSDAQVRAGALGALARCGALDDAICTTAAADPDPVVRRRLAETLGRLAARITDSPATDVPGAAVTVTQSLLTDSDPLVAESACWALGELLGPAEDTDGETDDRRPGVVAALAAVATGHDDPLAREAAVAALGALGDAAGREAVLAGTTDKPAVRRRAVLALAAFLGEPEVDAALQRALADRDWQVRQAAEVLLET
jgi:HEAT repeat protein